jgi:hypothetical protein
MKLKFYKLTSEPFMIYYGNEAENKIAHCKEISEEEFTDKTGWHLQPKEDEFVLLLKNTLQFQTAVNAAEKNNEKPCALSVCHGGIYNTNKNRPAVFIEL